MDSFGVQRVKGIKGRMDIDISLREVSLSPRAVCMQLTIQSFRV